MSLGIVVASFNEDIAVEMAKTAKETAEESGAIISEVIEVPGAFDVPLAVKKLLLNKKIDAVATLGAIIKGETAHDELIAKSTANKLSELSLEFNKPVTLGIIGPDADEDAADERKEEYAERAVNAAISLAKKLRR
ncbi:TPA: 6,7-dimethyl-8-ribityllumazine synthase [Candidatus Micrarchaeota archaeon]|nr:6,7-dimethyl-8-ribityllumazine synthase [Candidatus Micrarchaeota archaeon]